MCVCVLLHTLSLGEEMWAVMVEKGDGRCGQVICGLRRYSHATSVCSHRTVSPAVVCAGLPLTHTPALAPCDPSCQNKGWGGGCGRSGEEDVGEWGRGC